MDLNNKADFESRQDYLTSIFQYDHPFNENYDKVTREERQYVDLQPAVSPTTGRFLSFLVRLTQAKRVLEVGTSVGYSAHWIASALEQTGGKLVTVDNHERTAAEAKANFQKSGLQHRIEFYQEDATEFVRGLSRQIGEEGEGLFDIVLMDCAKKLYLPLLDDFHTLLKVGGLLAYDDTLIAWEKETRPGITKKILEFNAAIAKDNRFYTVNLPIGHGLTLLYKK